MSTKVIQSGNKYTVRDDAEVTIHTRLPAGNYTVKYHEMSGEFYLEPIDSFKIPTKLYGDTQVLADRILQTYEERNTTTGVLLEGVKGSGKTLLAKYVSHLALAYDMPTVAVNEPFCGDEFNKFIQSIEGKAIVIFDEFEKVYRPEDQEKILTLLDGVYPMNKLFFLTINQSGRFNNHMLNRPGRLYYRLEYGPLDEEFIREYAQDNLKNLDNLESLIRYAQVYNFLNFDMLQASIEEMNRYDETFIEVLNVLNVAPESNRYDSYTITASVPGVPDRVIHKDYELHVGHFRYQLDTDSLELPKGVASVYDAWIEDYKNVNFNEDHLITFDSETKSFIYMKEMDGVPIKLSIKYNDPWSASGTYSYLV